MDDGSMHKFHKIEQPNENSADSVTMLDGLPDNMIANSSSVLFEPVTSKHYNNNNYDDCTTFFQKFSHPYSFQSEKLNFDESASYSASFKNPDMRKCNPTELAGDINFQDCNQVSIKDCSVTESRTDSSQSTYNMNCTKLDNELQTEFEQRLSLDSATTTNNNQSSEKDREILDCVINCSFDKTPEIKYVCYESEDQMPDIIRLIQNDLSEPYSIYTYRYFIHNWPQLCFLALHGSRSVGAIVCKLDLHRKVIRRGYIAMLTVDKDYRKLKIGSNLVLKAIASMVSDGADEIVLETEITNHPALRLYENLGFVRDKRLFRYYLNGVDALRLKLWLR